MSSSEPIALAAETCLAPTNAKSAASLHDVVTPSSRPQVFDKGKHLPELDGLRGLAVLLVTVYRFTRDVPTSSVSGELLHGMVILGQRGVDLFFVLSGFLITGVLLDAANDPHRIRNFFARRTLRIFPLYFVSLVLFVLLLPKIWPVPIFVEAQENQFYLWTYLTNFRMAYIGDWNFGALDPFWSLSVEEHFYLLWPFLILFIGMRRTFAVAMGFAFVCALSRIGFSALHSTGVAPDVASFFRFDGLLIGAAIAALARSPGALERFRPYAKLSIVPITLVCLILAYKFNRLLTISHTAWAVLWGAFLILLVTAPRDGLLARFMRDTKLRRLGKYSYAMYVFQSPLIVLVAGVWSVPIIDQWLSTNSAESALPTIVYAVGMFALTFAAGVLSWYALESHCLKLKKFFENRSQERATA